MTHHGVRDEGQARRTRGRCDGAGLVAAGVCGAECAVVRAPPLDRITARPTSPYLAVFGPSDPAAKTAGSAQTRMNTKSDPLIR